MAMVVVESPLRGKTASEQQRNFRYLLWCLRAVWEVDGHHGIASHLVCPWFLDDSVESERDAGIGWEWFWDSCPEDDSCGHPEHMFFNDLGVSRGMIAAASVCRRRAIPHSQQLLSDFAPKHWLAFQRGEWPPHTAGFSLGHEGDT